MVVANGQPYKWDVIDTLYSSSEELAWLLLKSRDQNKDERSVHTPLGRALGRSFYA